ncbi:hypothetical protein [Capnocytophaga gingivalis]|uniref:hypothetical protein n=1 Tax=Capnocytophaga gingivalis TaxID=1017 RepID=UPI002B46D0A9|nr:hypothetical protein [Capnocytophaga gingivalis]
MSPKKRIKHYIFVFLFSLALFSCKRTIPDTTSDENVLRKDTVITNILTSEKEDKVTTEEKINNTELSTFLKELQVCLSQGQVTKMADTMVHYPLNDEGPLYEMLYGDIVYQEDFTTEDKPIVREDFIKIYHKLFPKKYIALFEKLNIEKIVQDKEFEWWNKEKTALIDFSFLTEDSFQISISFMEEDVIGGYSIKYLFKKINGNILLYLVRSI